MIRHTFCPRCQRAIVLLVHESGRVIECEAEGFSGIDVDGHVSRFFHLHFCDWTDRCVGPQ